MRERVFRDAVACLRRRAAGDVRGSGRLRWPLVAAGFVALSPAAAQEAITYGYDARGRLIKVVHSGTVNDGLDASYAYDDAENRTNVTVSTVAPSFSVNNVSATEGSALGFTITRSGTTTGSNSVSWATANGTATAGSDYTAASGTVSFLAGETTKPVSVATINDTAVESAETVLLNLSNASTGATISDSQGTGTINDNDTAGPSFSISNASVTEGGTLSFTVTKTGTTSSSYSVSYATANGTAASGSDYTAKSGTLTFTSTQTSQVVSIATTDDTTVESSETMVVNLSNASTGATISDSQGTGTINDNDTAAPSFAINDASVTEGGTMSFTVTKTGSTTTSYSLSFATANGTATSGSDYTAKSGTLAFAASETSKTISVVTLQDTLTETDETLYVNLSAATGGATITDAQGLGTILDDDEVDPCLASTSDPALTDSTTSSDTTTTTTTTTTDPATTGSTDTQVQAVPPPC